MSDKIAFFVNSLGAGGAEKILQNLLHGAGVALGGATVYCLKQEPVPPGYPPGVRFRFLFGAWRASDPGWKKLAVKIGNRLKLWVYHHCSPTLFYRLFVRGRYDVEVAFIEGFATRIVSGSTRPSRKLAWVHIDLSANHWSLNAYRDAEEERRAYRAFDTVVSVSEGVRASVEAIAGPLADARVLYNPMNLEEVRARSQETAPERPADTLFCAVGRLVPQKGFDLLLAACASLARAGYAFHVWILGDGPEREKLETQIACCGLAGRAELLGRKENPWPYMRAADWLVCPSRSEGYSTVIAESMILGTPVVSTPCAGVGEQLGDGEFGLVAPDGNEGLRRVLADILEGKIDRREFARKALDGATRFDAGERARAIGRLLLFDN